MKQRLTPLVLFLVPLLAGIAASSFAAKEKILIYTFDDSATYTRDNKTQPVRVDMPCKLKDVLKTDETGTVDFTLHGVAGVRIFSNGEAVLVKLAESDMRISLKKGGAGVRMKPPSTLSTELQLETPGGTARLKMGQFAAIIGPADKEGHTITTFMTKQGNVDIVMKAASSGVILRAGQAIDVPSKRGSIPAVRGQTPEEEQLLRQTNAISIS